MKRAVMSAVLPVDPVMRRRGRFGKAGPGLWSKVEGAAASAAAHSASATVTEENRNVRQLISDSYGVYRATAGLRIVNQAAGISNHQPEIHDRALLIHY